MGNLNVLTIGLAERNKQKNRQVVEYETGSLIIRTERTCTSLGERSLMRFPLDPFFFDMTEIDVTEEIYCGQCESLMLSRFSRVTAERDSRDLAERQSINFTVSIRANANYIVISMSGELQPHDNF